MGNSATCDVPKNADFVFEMATAGDFAVNPAAGAVAVTGVTSGDTASLTGTGYTTLALQLQTLTVAPTGLAVGVKPTKIVYTIKPSNNAGAALAKDGTITITADKEIFTKSGTPTIAVTTTSTKCKATSTSDANGKILTVKLLDD